MSKFISYENMQQIAEILKTRFSDKADASTTYTKSEVDHLIAASSGGVDNGEGNISINTSGAINNTSKLFLIGAQSQDIAPITYSRNSAYIGTDGCLYSGNNKVVTSTNSFSSEKGEYNLSDGIQMRYGIYNGALNSYQFTITFETPFTNECLYADLMSRQANTSNPRGVYSVVKKSATSITFGIPQVVTGGVYWIAFGY